MKNPTQASIAQRKAKLVEEGAAYRSGIGEAAQAIEASLRMESLARNALGYLATIGFGLLKKRTGAAGVGLQTALPLLIGGISVLKRKPWVKSLLRSALIAGTVGTVVSMVARKKKAVTAPQISKGNGHWK